MPFQLLKQRITALPWLVGHHHLGLLVALVTVLTVNSTHAHEGHQPLPTKGVQVDTEHGHLTLSAQARSAIGLEAEEVLVGDVGSSLVTYAETVAPWQSQAYGSAQLSGRITKLLMRPGDFVAKGQIVAELTSRELETVRLNYLQAKNDMSLNRKLIDSTQAAAQAGAVPRQRADELEIAYQQSANDLEIARIRATTLGLDAKQFDDENNSSLNHLIRSPIAGKIIHSDLSEGKFVEAFEHLFEIVNLDEVWVKIQVLEKDVGKLSVGQKVDLELHDSIAPIETKIDRVEVALDPQGQVCWAWATVAQPSVAHPSILPGLVGSAKIHTSAESNRLSVPLSSVYSDGLQSYVFVEEASTKTSSEYRKRNVRLGTRAASAASTGRAQVEIVQSALYPGDRVVVKGGHELSSLFFLGVLKLSNDDRTRLGIRTALAELRPLAAALNLPATATLPPEARWIASSQLPGTIHSHTLSPGKKVQAGELLMELAAPEFHSLQLDLVRTSLDAGLVRQRAERIQQAGKDTVARRTLLEMLNRADQLELKAESLKRQLISLGLSHSDIENVVKQRQILSFLPIRSPLDGYLVRWNSTLGETVVANQALAEIQNVQDIWIEAQVPSQDTPRLSLSDTGFVSALSAPSIKYSASVTRIGPVVSATTRTQRIWLKPDAVPNSFVLRAGTQLSVALNVSERVTAIVVPSEAVLRDGLNAFVFVQKVDGYLDRRRVTTGRSDGQWTEIGQGITPGDEVIVAGGRELQTAFASLR